MIMYIFTLASAFWVVRSILKNAIEGYPAGSTQRILLVMHRVYFMIVVGLGCAYFLGTEHVLTSSILTLNTMVFVALLFPDYDRLIDLKI